MRAAGIKALSVLPLGDPTSSRTAIRICDERASLGFYCKLPGLSGEWQR